MQKTKNMPSLTKSSTLITLDASDIPTEKYLTLKNYFSTMKNPETIEQKIYTFVHEVCDFIQESRLEFHVETLTHSIMWEGVSHPFACTWNPDINCPTIYICSKEIEKRYNIFRPYPAKWEEYEHYEDDREIGNFYSQNPEHFLRYVILHELAHAVNKFDYHEKYYPVTIGGMKDLGHGSFFQEQYRILRNKFLNPHLPDQKEARETHLIWREKRKTQSKNILAQTFKTSYNTSEIRS